MKNKGFSLVELIVVIAIMAILVGVAVPVYTSYISKAQKNKDIQMVDEIKHAVEIAAIGDKWYEVMPNGGVVGTIVITETGMTVNDETTAKLLENAINNTFGADNSLKLSYDEWTGTLNAINAELLASSAYVANEGSVTGLLNKVQDVTDAFKEFVASGTELGSGVSQYLQQTLGIDASNPNNAQETANGMVLYIADSSKNIDEAAFIDAWNQYDFSSPALGLDAFSQMAAKYAYAEAMVNRLNCPTLTALFAEQSVVNLAGDGEEFSVTDPIDCIESHVGAGCANCEAKGPTITLEEYTLDAKAYLVLLEQISNSENIVASNVSNSALYTNSPLVDYVNSYVSVADLVNQAGGAKDGDIVIVFMLSSDGQVKANTYPLDYVAE